MAANSREVQRKADAKRKGKRFRNWVFILYPESAPPDWMDRLKDEFTPGFVSPLHDADTNPDGTPKKPHYHVLLAYHSAHTFEQVKEVTDALNAPHPQHVKDLQAQARYLCHMDNPEKEQYPASDVVCLCGADYLEAAKSAADTDAAVADMMDWCIEQGCYSFYRLSNYAREKRPDWFRVITTQRTVFMTSWLKSMKWERDGALGSRRESVADERRDQWREPPTDDEKNFVSG